MGKCWRKKGHHQQLLLLLLLPIERIKYIHTENERLSVVLLLLWTQKILKFTNECFRADTLKKSNW